jgi:chromosome segregation ATPase
MVVMAAAPADALLALAAELERRDDAIAGELETVRGLEERAAAVRVRVVEVRDALERLPFELEDVERRRREAEDDAAVARADLDRAASRLAGLESSRRRRDDELDRARKEAATAEEALADTLARQERIDELDAALRADAAKLHGEVGELARAAERVAADLRGLGRLADGARREPGATLQELDDWGGQVRSALFVARGTLEAERERVVVEANELGASVLGEQLGASGVALVRRRLEAHFGS